MSCNGQCGYFPHVSFYSLVSQFCTFRSELIKHPFCFRAVDLLFHTVNDCQLEFNLHDTSCSCSLSNSHTDALTMRSFPYYPSPTPRSPVVSTIVFCGGTPKVLPHCYAFSVTCTLFFRLGFCLDTSTPFVEHYNLRAMFWTLLGSRCFVYTGKKYTSLLTLISECEQSFSSLQPAKTVARTAAET